ncbi:porin [Parasutterella secunda]|uniref:Porin n=1 Tax=Parasutterella secunda TaxID=626947 RepID=A0ABS2GTL4_9BURK|nr:porin [Parasutterella secunda]MBM6928087.1 porin [Parasutterella secunda]
MKKTLAAVAVLGAFAGSAIAADVTLYGRIDEGLLYQRVDADQPHQSAENSWGLESGNMTSSRFGIKGSEQISEDLTVSFTLEQGFNPDDGSFGDDDRMFNREASLRVTTAYGELGFGRMGRVLSDAGTYSQRGEFILGSSWGGMTGGTELITDKTSSRLDNMITYKSPTFAGMTVYAQYAGGDTAAADSEEENTSKTDRYYGLAALGNWGAWSAMLGVEQTNYQSWFPATGTGEDVDDSIGVEASVAYDFGAVKTALTGRYFKDSAGYNTIVSDYQIERIDGYGVKLAAAAPVFGGTLQGMVGYMDAESSDDKEFGDLEVSRYTVALTYDYPLSKRMKLYTAASYTKDDFKDNNDSTNDAKPNNTAFVFGMAHYF